MHHSFFHVLTLLCLACLACGPTMQAAETAEPRRLDIWEYRIRGSVKLPQKDVERAVYPYLGKLRTVEDVEAARLALEKAYQAAGYQSIGVQIPPQEVVGGIVRLQVVEGTVGRLRVHGSRYFDLNEIKEAVPSLAEGQTPNFQNVEREIVALNQHSDRKVIPTLRAGVVPGTVDVDLNVEDKLPLHGSLELNNRYSSDTKPLRLSGSLRYDNLWQLGHSAGFSFQVAPERTDDAKVFSAFYLAKLPDKPVSLLVQAVKQDSDVSTLGTFDVAGRGEIVGVRAIISLPPKTNYYHNLTFGIDYKKFEEDLTITGAPGALQTPITYYPMSAEYSSTWVGENAVTQFNIGAHLHIRGLGSDPSEWDNKRYKSGGSYLYVRADLSQTRDLPDDWKLFGKIQGQFAGQPLLSGEQFGAGGLGTVRGYLESEVTADNAFGATLELRTPSLTFGGFFDELRLHTFAEWAGLTLNEPLPGQKSRFQLGSVGAGFRFKLKEHFNGSLDLGLPLLEGEHTEKNDPRLTFRLWSEF
ncbi:hemin-binding protein [Opitutaceae bacterium TAV5]|nr:hemin-binding protein [Opitutaceae bacterium TAV5]